jgi:cell division septum initiation protein DivIVA
MITKEAKIDGYNTEYVAQAMDLIQDELQWVDAFPRQAHARINTICEFVKRKSPLPARSWRTNSFV